jgi:hypothetical protein
VTGVGGTHLGLDSRKGHRFYVSHRVYILAVGPTHFRIQWVPVREDHEVPASGTEIKDA